MITKAELQKKFVEIFSTPDAFQADAIQSNFMQFYGFIAANYEQLDPEAKASTDAMTDAIEKQSRQTVSDMPDGPDKKCLERLLARMSGTHQSADKLITILDTKPHFEHAVLKAGEALFVEKLQQILDLLFDVTQRSHRGPAGFARLAIAHSTINELLLAHHLAQRAFINQFYAHIRVVFENKDKIQLFAQSPEWAEKWIHNPDDKDVRYELQPASVREKLGRPRYDEIYGAFSSLGTHSTFDSVRLIAGRTDDGSQDHYRSFKVWIGGCPREDQLIYMQTLLLYTALQFFLSLSEHFSGDLDPKDNLQTALAFVSDFKNFLSVHFLPWASKNSLDTSDIESSIEKLNKHLESDGFSDK